MTEGEGGGEQASGAFVHVAPEIIMEGKAGFSADVYSFGVILWYPPPPSDI